MYVTPVVRSIRDDPIDGIAVVETDTAGCNFVELFATPGWGYSPRDYSRQYDNAVTTDPDGAGEDVEYDSE